MSFSRGAIGPIKHTIVRSGLSCEPRPAATRLPALARPQFLRRARYRPGGVSANDAYPERRLGAVAGSVSFHGRSTRSAATHTETVSHGSDGGFGEPTDSELACRLGGSAAGSAR